MKQQRIINIEIIVDDDVRIKANYSRYVNEATIKIIYKNKPNLKWTSTFKHEVDYETFKEFCLQFTFNEQFTINDIIEFFQRRV